MTNQQPPKSRGRMTTSTGEGEGSERAALLVHDLRNGLMVAQANLELIELESEKLSSLARESLSDSMTALERMGVLLSQFLDVHRLEEGRYVRRQEIDLEPLLARCVDAYTIRRSRAHIEVAAPGVHAAIDASMLERAVANVLFNAIRYVDSGGTIRLAATSDVDSDGRSLLVVDIGNSGDPPPAHVSDVLFSKYGVGATGQRGLGLYFCRLVCEAHGGRIEMHPLPGLPTNFRMLLY